MTLELIRSTLAWCTVLNIGLLLLWGGLFLFAHDWIFKIHGTWFRLSVEEFDAIQYKAMAQYKMALTLFNLVPYLALRIVG